LKYFLDLKIPAIIVPHNPDIYPNFPVIKTDGENISRMASGHLFDKGFRNFAFSGYYNLPWSIERQKFFEQFIIKSGYSVSIFFQSKSPAKRKWEIEQSLLAEWLKKLPTPVGIMACNDDRAQQVIEACKIAKLRIPDDVGVIGVDNDDLICDLCDPPLTSIAMNVEKIGYEAAESLDKMMKNKSKLKDDLVVKPTHVKTRYSTDIVFTEDAELAKAISFIRQNFRSTIQVADVVKATSLSRRTLEQRFKQKLNRSINSEIKRLRIEHICSLLLETDLSISDIAYGLDFSSMEHISRYFHKETGKSLREFRKLKVSAK
jgi:LacI family transcriptional regulator